MFCIKIEYELIFIEIPKPPPRNVYNWNDAQTQVARLLSENNQTSTSADGASSSALPNFGNVGKNWKYFITRCCWHFRNPA